MTLPANGESKNTMAPTITAIIHTSIRTNFATVDMGFQLPNTCMSNCISPAIGMPTANRQHTAITPEVTGKALTMLQSMTGENS